jgi:hypothetical protein
MTKPTAWKGINVTVGVLVAIVMGAGGVALYTLRGQAQVEKTCAGKVNGHETKSADVAHPDLQNRYVTREELVKQVGDLKVEMKGVKTEMGGVKTAQQTILREIRSIRRRRHRGTP